MGTTWKFMEDNVNLTTFRGIFFSSICFLQNILPDGFSMWQSGLS